jgi:predicted Fe-Mo cluster-binding NifX family protein
MRIAFATDDGKEISAHFGRAQYYLVVDVRDGKEAGREMVLKSRPSEHVHGPGEERRHGKGHGAKFELLEGCDVLIVRGMGQRAFGRAQDMGLEIFVCDEKTVDAALAAYLGGALPHNPARVHEPHH